jgi:Rod binding domain-containing protein
MIVAGISPAGDGSKDNLSAARKAAQDFEAMLIGSLLRSLERTFSAAPGENKPAGSDDYQYLGTEALAGAVAAGGGLGLARDVVGKLLKTQPLSGGHDGAPKTQVSPSSADVYGS